MPQKQCERCKQAFNCNVDNISACQCSTVTLNQNELDFIAAKHLDCLCAACMQALKLEYLAFTQTTEP